MTHPYDHAQSGDPGNDVVVIEEADDERARDPDASNTDASNTDASNTDADFAEADDFADLSDVASSDAVVADEPAAPAAERDIITTIPDQPGLALVPGEPSLTGDGYEPSHAAGDAEPGLAASREWQDIQALFVDDPRGAVELAAAAADSAVSTLMTALREQQAALTPAGSGSADTTPADPSETEQLRAALRGYRSLCQNLAQVGTSLSTATPA